MKTTATMAGPRSSEISADRSWRSSHHDNSHRALLGTPTVDQFDSAGVDALVVPTARPGRYLRHAVDLAARLGRPLVALCSREASADQAARLAVEANVELIALDIVPAELPGDLVPNFRTTRLLAGSGFSSPADVSVKRNLALLLVRAMGWRRIFFLDDDVTVPDHRDIEKACDLLGTYAAVGLDIKYFPDNSAVCHAYRETGGAQGTFIGGGALAFDASATRSFFPDVYNDDWFFLLRDAGLRRVAIVGNATQRPYDPFGDGSRARSEEFGDCLAEGVFWQLDKRRQVRDADERHWERFLAERRVFIEEIFDRADNSRADTTGKDAMTTALCAAYEQNLLIEPALCAAYLRAWQADSELWREHSDELCRKRTAGLEFPPRRGALSAGRVEKVLSNLGLMACSRYVPST